MAARSTRGPGGRGGRRPMSTGRGRRGSSSSGCAIVAVPITAGLVLGVSLILTPLATRVWTKALVPAANRFHFGDLLVPSMLLAGLLLYVAVSLLLVPRPKISPAGSIGQSGAHLPGPGQAGQGAAWLGVAGQGKE